MKLPNMLSLFTIICMAVLLGCSFEEDGGPDEAVPAEKITEITLVDIEGRSVKLKKKAERIVDLTGLSGTRILIQLGAPQYIVGMTSNGAGVFDSENSTYYPVQRAMSSMIRKDIINIGDWKEPNAEKIIALNPDVIFIGWGGKESAEKIEQQTGVPAICIGRMDGHFDYDRYRLVGKVIGKEQKAEETIAYLKRKIAMVTGITNKIPDNEKKRVFFWIVPRVDADLRSNGMYDAINYGGGINVASTEKGIGLYETSKEQVVAWNPDVIFAQSSHKKDKRESYADYLTVEQICDDPLLQHTNAIQNRNVYYLRGPRSDWDTAIEAAEVFYIAKLLYPEKFKEMDVIKEGNEIFRTLYGVENLYTEMSENVGLYVW